MPLERDKMTVEASEFKYMGTREISTAIAVVTLSGNSEFRFQAGQYVQIVVPAGGTRSYSIANVDDGGGSLEFHVRRWPDGEFSYRLLNELKVGDRVRLRGPFGSMRWREGEGPAIMMATGTGIAPIRALLLERERCGSRRPVMVFEGGRSENDLYLLKLCDLAFGSDVRYVPVLSRPPEGWCGRSGYVQDAVLATVANLIDADVFVCGSPAMVDASRIAMAGLVGHALDRFHSDAFVKGASSFLADMVQAPAPSLRFSIVLQTGSHDVIAKPGMTVLAALKGAGIDIQSVCGGQASCATCRFSYTTAEALQLPEPSRSERRLLKSLEDYHEGERLACQVVLAAIHDGLVVSPTFPILNQSDFAQGDAQ